MRFFRRRGRVAGAKANDLRAVLGKPVGDTLRLKTKHGSSEPRAVTLTAAQKT